MAVKSSASGAPAGFSALRAPEEGRVAACGRPAVAGEGVVHAACPDQLPSALCLYASRRSRRGPGEGGGGSLAPELGSVLAATVLATALALLPLAIDAPARADGFLGEDDALETLQATGVRIKDITDVQGVRDNQLIGYGLVVGLQGSGDTLRNSPYTERALASMLDRLGVDVRDTPLRARNVAAVMVTADLPPFVGPGARIDVTISSIGDATSLRGGTLLMTPLAGGNAEVYAVAQGPVAVSGFVVEGAAAELTQGVPTAGRIPNGALVEREVPGRLDGIDPLVLELRNPDFRTAALISDAINHFGRNRYGRPLARARDLRSVVVHLPDGVNPTRFLARIGALRVTPDTPARVVIDQRTGTVVVGQNVQITTVGVAHGNLVVRVTEEPLVAQPLPFSDGETVVVPRTEVEAEEQDGQMTIVGGTDLQTLVDGLNRLGLTPTDIISILQAIKTAGALQADLVIQ